MNSEVPSFQLLVLLVAEVSQAELPAGWWAQVLPAGSGRERGSGCRFGKLL